MRIAFFVHRFPVVSETFVLRQITGLIDLGHEVDIYSERSPEGGEPMHAEFAKYKLHERTTYLDVEMPPASGYWSMPVWPITGETWLPGSEQPTRNSDRILEAIPAIHYCLTKAPKITIQVLDPDQYGDQAVSLESIYHLSSLLRRRGDYDVLHAHFGPIGNNYRFVRTLWNVPLVVTFHGYDFSAIPRTAGTDVYQRLFQVADCVTAVSDYAAERIKKLGCPDEKIRTLHVGINAKDFAFRPRIPQPGHPVKILTVGRFVEKKGFEYLLGALAILRRKSLDVRCKIVGDGPLRTALEDSVRDKGIDDVVTLCGAANCDTVRQLLDDADLFVLPSVTATDGDQEGIPVSLMEAQACGLPVISTLHSGIPELVTEGRSGFLVPERNAEALADRISYLIAHTEIWPEMGREARKMVEAGFESRELNCRLVQLYERLISNHGSRGAKRSMADAKSVATNV